MPEYLTPKKAMMKFGVCRITLNRWADKGLIETIRTPGNHRRFNAASIEAAVGLLPKIGYVVINSGPDGVVEYQGTKYHVEPNSTLTIPVTGEQIENHN